MAEDLKTGAPSGTENDAQQPAQPSHFVGIGASAGGLEAIEAFFNRMPSRSGLAFIVVQHLSPDYKSLMVELLSKRTEMDVLRAEDGMTVEPDKVYLIPPKKNLKIFHGKLLLDEQDFSKGLNLPIDIFFSSLAEDQGEKAIGVVLSGTGSDGMRGTRSIKENGGMIMVQDEESAKFDGMPRAAVSTGLADFILPPEEMPDQLLAFTKHPYTAKPDRKEILLSDEDGMTRIFALLRERSKVDFTFYKPSTVTRRIERRISVNQLDGIDEYVDFIQTHPGEIMALYRELLIGVTSFFRDPEGFDLLGESWLPELFKQKENKELRFWIAGCSTGEEAYTFAILARECMEQIGRSLDVKIFATDVDKDAIMRAGSGVYPASIAADLSPRLIAKYFYHKEDSFQIARNIREMVVFAQHNLIKDPPFTNIDLVSCRNLLIYLQPVLQKKVLEMMNFSLNTNGLLVLGTSETVGEMTQYFKVLSQKYKIYKSTGRLKPVLNAQDMFVAAGRKVHEQGLGRTLTGPRYRLTGSDKTLERFLESISGDYVPLALIVNEHMEVQHVFGDTEGFFKLPSGRISNDISKMAIKDLAIPLTTGIQKVFRTDEELHFSNIHIRHAGSTTSVNLRIRPLPRKKGAEPMVAVFLDQVQVAEPKSEEMLSTYDLSAEAEQRIKDLEQELQFSRENLQATIEELETANEELQATNEELLASNEELQSTNEELHTVNAEYQNKIIELTELNNDVDNLLFSSQIGTLLLDENLEIRKFSPQVAHILKILDSDIGRPITHLNHHILDRDPFDLIRQVQDSAEPAEEPIRVESGRWYLMRVLPYKIGPQRYSGIVVSFVEISRLMEAEQALAVKETDLRRTARLARVGSWEYDLQTEALTWSDETYRIHELEPGRPPTLEMGINYYAPESIPIITEAFGRSCSHGEPYDLVLEIITAKGNRRWVRAISEPRLEDGRVVKINGSFQDITEIKEMDAALKESEKQLQYLFDSMNHGFAVHEIIVDDDGKPVDYRFLDANPAFEQLTGLKPKEIIGRTVREVLPQTEDYWIERFGAVALEGKPDRFENYSGELDRWYSVSAYSMEKNQFCVLVADITEKKEQDEELRRSEELFRSLFETMAQGVVYQNAAGEIIRANPASTKILGLTLDQMQGRTSMDPAWKAIMEDGRDFPGEQHPAMIALKTGRPVMNTTMGVFNPIEDRTKWININAVPQFLPGEERPYQVYTTFEDLTQRYEAEQSIKIVKERLDLAFLAAGMGWWDWDIPNRKLEVCPNILRMLGYEPEEVGNRLDDWLQLIHPEDRERVGEAMRAHLEGRAEKYEISYRLRARDGSYQRVRDQGRIAARGADGEPRRVIGGAREDDSGRSDC